MVEQQPDEPVNAVDAIYLTDIGDQLTALAAQLAAVGAHTDRKKFRPLEKAVELIGDDESEEALREAHTAAVRQLLIGLGQFRRSYDHWERLTAEYALKQGVTQRDAAAHLGVAVSTINRWAQHPLTNESDRR